MWYFFLSPRSQAEAEMQFFLNVFFFANRRQCCRPHFYWWCSSLRARAFPVCLVEGRRILNPIIYFVSIQSFYVLSSTWTLKSKIQLLKLMNATRKPLNNPCSLCIFWPLFLPNWAFKKVFLRFHVWLL